MERETLVFTKRLGKVRYPWMFIRMNDEAQSELFAGEANACTWCYTKDLQPHGRIPAVVLPVLIEACGGEEKLHSAGYRKFWTVFYNPDTGKYTFGNQYGFSRSPLAEDRQAAVGMMEVDIDTLP